MAKESKAEERREDKKEEAKKERDHEKRAHGGAILMNGPTWKKGEKRAAGGALALKRGGHVPGHKSEHRPDKRARGGATSDADPLTSAGKMSSLPFEKKNQPSSDQGGTAMEKRSD